MRLLTGLNCAHYFPKGAATTIGNFDGVHKGHQALLTSLKEKALAQNLPLVLVLFEPQPSEFFKRKDSSKPRLQSLREKLKSLKNLGVDYVYRLKFNQDLAKMSAQDFASTILFKYLNTRLLMVGQDFRFGFQREGDITLLKSLAKLKHCQIEIFPDFTKEAERVSSTKIRSLLENGALIEAKSLLGRDYFLCARVVEGQGLGRKWGIPTANLKLNRPPLPLKGVFCVKVRLQTGEFLEGVANIGLRPTVNGVTMVTEVHLLNFNTSLYGQLLQVFFCHKLRDEKKFPSVEDLIHQIHQDIQKTKDYFNREKV